MLAKNSVSDIEKREKKVLEKKLGEMEDELKVNIAHLPPVKPLDNLDVLPQFATGETVILY